MEEEDRSQDCAARFVRACATDMRVNMLQKPIFKPKINYTNNAAAHNLGPLFVRACAVEMHINRSKSHFILNFTPVHNIGPHFAQASAVDMHINMSQEPCYTEIYRKKALVHNLGPHTLREPPQSTCTSTCHKNHVIRKFTGKRPQSTT